MPTTKQQKTDLITNYRTHDGDTGSPEVQIALLSNRITYLTEHFKSHAKDHHAASLMIAWRALPKEREAIG